MKIRVTILAENAVPAEMIGATREEQSAQIKRGYEFLLNMYRVTCDTMTTKMTVESAEVLE